MNDEDVDASISVISRSNLPDAKKKERIALYEAYRSIGKIERVVHFRFVCAKHHVDRSATFTCLGHQVPDAVGRQLRERVYPEFAEIGCYDFDMEVSFKEKERWVAEQEAAE